jgi:hypothetical protein
VRLESGRQFTGEISPRTNDERLWLVQRVGSASLARPITWNNITAAHYREQWLTGPELQQHLRGDAATIQSASSHRQAGAEDQEQNPFADDPTENSTEELPLPDDQPAQSPVTIRSRAQWLAMTTPPVASVRFDAHLANWDADVEADGLVVQIVPVDSHGQVVAVRGSLQVELFGVRRIAFQDAPTKRGRSFDRLGLWTQLLVPEMIHSDGGWFKLPFQAAQPEFDPAIGYSGLVHVKLIVPGAGVFEDSLDGVRLRPFAPLRDSMQQNNGQRFFPTETTGLGKRAW